MLPQVQALLTALSLESGNRHKSWAVDYLSRLVVPVKYADFTPEVYGAVHFLPSDTPGELYTITPCVGGYMGFRWLSESSITGSASLEDVADLLVGTVPKGRLSPLGLHMERSPGDYLDFRQPSDYTLGPRSIPKGSSLIFGGGGISLTLDAEGERKWTALAERRGPVNDLAVRMQSGAYLPFHNFFPGIYQVRVASNFLLLWDAAGRIAAIAAQAYPVAQAREDYKSAVLGRYEARKLSLYELLEARLFRKLSGKELETFRGLAEGKPEGVEVVDLLHSRNKRYAAAVSQFIGLPHPPKKTSELHSAVFRYLGVNEAEYYRKQAAAADAAKAAKAAERKAAKEARALAEQGPLLYEFLTTTKGVSISGKKWLLKEVSYEDKIQTNAEMIESLVGLGAILGQSTERNGKLVPWLSIGGSGPVTNRTGERYARWLVAQNPKQHVALGALIRAMGDAVSSAVPSVEGDRLVGKIFIGWRTIPDMTEALFMRAAPRLAKRVHTSLPASFGFARVRSVEDIRADGTATAIYALPASMRSEGKQADSKKGGPDSGSSGGIAKAASTKAAQYHDLRMGLPRTAEDLRTFTTNLSGLSAGALQELQRAGGGERSAKSWQAALTRMLEKQKGAPRWIRKEYLVREDGTDRRITIGSRVRTLDQPSMGRQAQIPGGNGVVEASGTVRPREARKAVNTQRAMLVRFDIAEIAASGGTRTAQDEEQARKKQEEALLRGVLLDPREDILDASRKAAEAGAVDPRYVGAGGTGIVFEAQGRAYKVARAHAVQSLRMEAAVLEALDREDVAKFFAWDDEHGVLIRQHIEGKPGTMATKGLHDAHKRISEAMRAEDFTPAEFKEDSFIVKPGGALVMVDLGGSAFIGQRLAESLKTTDYQETKTYLGASRLSSSISGATQEGAISPQLGLRYARQILHKGVRESLTDRLKAAAARIVPASDPWDNFGTGDFIGPHVAAERIHSVADAAKFVSLPHAGGVHGFLWQRDGSISRIVATDGHALAILSLNFPLPAAWRGRNLLLPRTDGGKLLPWTRRELSADVLANAPTLDMEFPDYPRAVPQWTQGYAQASVDVPTLREFLRQRGSRAGKAWARRLKSPRDAASVISFEGIRYLDPRVGVDSMLHISWRDRFLTELSSLGEPGLSGEIHFDAGILAGVAQAADPRSPLHLRVAVDSYGILSPWGHFECWQVGERGHKVRSFVLMGRRVN